jgi:hypothetical protein
MTDENNPRLAGATHVVRIKLVRSPEAANLREYEGLLLLALLGPEARVVQRSVCSRQTPRRSARATDNWAGVWLARAYCSRLWAD